VGECFFWYRPTRVVPDQRPLNGRCCCCLLNGESISTNSTAENRDMYNFFHPLYEAAVGVLLEIMPIVVVRFGRLNIGCLCCKALINWCDY